MQEDVEELRSHLVRMVLDRDFQFSRQESDMCDSIPTGCLLDVEMGDCQLPVAETLMGNFHILFWDMKGERQKDWAVKLQKYSQGQEAMGRTMWLWNWLCMLRNWAPSGLVSRPPLPR